MPRPLAAILLSSASSDSIISGTSQIPAGLEITEEQHLLHMSGASSSSDFASTPTQSRNNRRRRPLRQGLAQLSARLSTSNNKPAMSSAPLSSQVAPPTDAADAQSTGDLSRAIHVMNAQSLGAAPVDRDAVTVSGLYSVGTYQTFSSLDTVKASNKAVAGGAACTPGKKNNKGGGGDTSKSHQALQATDSSGSAEGGKSKRWKHWKKAMQVVVRSASFPEKRGKSEDDTPTPLQSRSRSAGSTDTAACTTVGCGLPEDELKRGRWDGMDVLSLGSAFERIWTKPQRKASSNNSSSNEVPWNEWTESCIGANQTRLPAQAVQEMLQAAAGQSPPDMILEGFCDAERWSMRIEQLPAQQAPPPLPPTSPNRNDGGLPDMPSQKLWTTLWGSQPTPASTLPTLEEVLGSTSDEQDGDNHGKEKHDQIKNSKTSNSNTSQLEDDPLLDLAAESSVPIDVDEDTFIVSTPDHLDAIHAIVSVPIAAGKFAAANRILQKLLLGLDSAVSETHIKDNLRGATCHNMGLLYLWQGDYAAAVESFSQAVAARRKCPLATTRDVAVTLVRQGQALFALGQFAEALECFQEALPSTTADQAVRAKILTNIGVAHYHLQELSKALDAFTQALTIQRKWLDEPVRRESLVYAASVTLSNMGKLYLERGDDAMASFVYEEALLLLKTVFRKEHTLIVTGLQNLAFSKARQSQGLKAIKLLERCRRIQVSVYGTSSAAPVIETCGWMAHLCAAQHKTAQAQTLYQAVYAWQKAFLPSKHPARERIRACLEELPFNVPAAGWL